ncbi:uncharacterized protein LOC109721703 [Ananas comosus]|uniref:Uncharacterized protein LOC109721703 n=1 Tax=Ananas comosus TaxID=4615 RepID=A0A6P5GIA0_ANACO|nr:uncharacterized protein LOC109721703 [Ananas comosus]XP_020105035.1 uncharacterized protein LOC109721703 [Ananas comosus]
MAGESIGEEQEALFHYSASPCAAVYYVQSPSTTSHANSTHPPSDNNSAFLSPFPAPDDVAVTTFVSHHHRHRDEAADASHRLALSRYSSSRGSNNSFLHEKKVAYGGRGGSADGQFGSGGGGGRQVLRIVTGRQEEEEEEEEEEDGGGRRSGVWRFLALDPTAPCVCILFQVMWKLAMSAAFGLLVFFLATKPKPPKVSFKVGKMEQFNLGEGVDNTGVITKILTCNCSINMEIENYSKVFGLHVHPPTLEMAFGRLRFATSQGEESYVAAVTSLTLNLSVAVKNKPMYGAGWSMQDMLDSGRGLLLLVRVQSRSSYRAVWNLIRLRYHHHAECFLFLRSVYHTQIYNSTCNY